MDSGYPLVSFGSGTPLVSWLPLWYLLACDRFWLPFGILDLWSGYTFDILIYGVWLHLWYLSTDSGYPFGIFWPVMDSGYPFGILDLRRLVTPLVS